MKAARRPIRQTAQAPLYRFYTFAHECRITDSASLPNDEAALLHAYGFMGAGASADVWESMRNIAQLWGELAPRAPPATRLRWRWCRNRPDREREGTPIRGGRVYLAAPDRVELSEAAGSPDQRAKKD